MLAVWPRDAIGSFHSHSKFTNLHYTRGRYMWNKLQLSDQQDLTRLPSNAKLPDSKWTKKPFVSESPTIFHLCVTRPSDIFVNFILNISPLLTFTQSVDLFHSLIVLWANENVLVLINPIYTNPQWRSEAKRRWGGKTKKYRPQQRAQ